MRMPPYDLTDTLRQLAARNPGRTEADVQATVRDILLHGGFDLEDAVVRLEAPAENRRRVDVTVGALIIECKKTLRSHSALTDAEAQLGAYLAGKAAAGQRYVGVLTDGAVWCLYRWTPEALTFVSRFDVSPTAPDERGFRLWLGSILATEQGLPPASDLIAARLGAASPFYQMARGLLRQGLDATREQPAVAVKRRLWAQLLRSALGTQFEDTDDLFADHTYLVLTATLIAHAVMGFDLRDAARDARALLTGRLFDRAGLVGIGHAGFFDWVLDWARGWDVLDELIRRVRVFHWAGVDHDVLKALYQSVIAPEVRHRLGEYYTPDWLARHMVEHVVDNPLHQRVLDPACGSGTFVFHAVRRYLDAADATSIPLARAVSQVTNHVMGMDLHPVAVVLAQTTYLLAVGPDRLRARPPRLAIPVYLGDSMRWELSAHEGTFTAAGDIVLATDAAGNGTFDSEIRLPASLVSDVTAFDARVEELVARATERAPGSPPLPLDGWLKAHGIPERDWPMVRDTYALLCALHDAGRDHIWGFYIRNQARPAWLSLPDHHVDVLIGNPPWLAYRYMANLLKNVFEQRARERRLWRGGAQGRTTQHDLSAFFVARAAELYLRQGGRFAFVMPRAVLTRQTYAGFRQGNFSGATLQLAFTFEVPWDLSDVKPDPFPVPSCVVLGQRAAQPGALPSLVRRFPRRPDAVDAKANMLPLLPVQPVTGNAGRSPYKARFRAGAVLFPRVLIMVLDAPPRALAPPAGSRHVVSRKSTLDKPPWKNIPAREDIVEEAFLRPAHLGESIAPFRVLQTFQAVVPWDGRRLLDGSSEDIDQYPGLAAWWRWAEEVWMSHRTSEKRTLVENVDYMHQLTAQFSVSPYRVVYTASGTTLTATVVRDARAVIEHSLYWLAADSEEEALYLTAILNAPTLDALVKPYQSTGAFGPRHFDKYVWEAPIPLFDPRNPLHSRLAALGHWAEAEAFTVVFPTGMPFQRARQAIRDHLRVRGILAELDEAVRMVWGEAAGG